MLSFIMISISCVTSIIQNRNVSSTDCFHHILRRLYPLVSNDHRAELFQIVDCNVLPTLTGARCNHRVLKLAPNLKDKHFHNNIYVSKKRNQPLKILLKRSLFKILEEYSSRTSILTAAILILARPVLLIALFPPASVNDDKHRKTKKKKKTLSFLL